MSLLRENIVKSLTFSPAASPRLVGILLLPPQARLTLSSTFFPALNALSFHSSSVELLGKTTVTAISPTNHPNSDFWAAVGCNGEQPGRSKGISALSLTPALLMTQQPDIVTGGSCLQLNHSQHLHSGGGGHPNPPPSPPPPTTAAEVQSDSQTCSQTLPDRTVKADAATLRLP